MNKFAEQFQNDVATRYQEKLAGALLDKIIHAIPKVEVYGSERPTWQSLFDKVRQLKPTVHF